MSEFSSIANLEVRPTGMDAARREIERELGDVEVGVTANRPTGRGGGAVGARGPEPAGVDLNRRQLGQQEALVELATERNDILQELLEEGGDGGGGFLRTAGTLGLATQSTGMLGAAVANPFTALAGLTLGTGAFAATQTTEEERQDQRGGPGPGPRDRPPEFGTDRPTAADLPASAQRFFDNLAGDPAGRTGPRTTEPPDRAPRAGGTKESTVNVDATANVEVSDSPRRSEIERFVQRRIRQAVEDIKRDLRRELGGDTSPRTTSSGGGGTSGGRLRR